MDLGATHRQRLEGEEQKSGIRKHELREWEIGSKRVRARVVGHLYIAPYYGMNPLLETLRYGP